MLKLYNITTNNIISISSILSSCFIILLSIIEIIFGVQDNFKSSDGTSHSLMLVYDIKLISNRI